MRAKKPGAKKQDVGLDVQEIHLEAMSVGIIGTSPLIYNAVSEKSKRKLLLPPRTTKADRAKILRSDPMASYRASVYRVDDGPTALCLKCNMFKGAIANVALEMGGASKAAIGRLLTVEGDKTALYGTPQMILGVMREGLNRTPVVRTRAIVPAPWVCEFSVQFVTPNLNARTVINLLGASGVICGVGDSRPQKGKASFGQFRIVNEKDHELVEKLKQLGGRAAQEAALQDPEFYDEESRSLYDWFVKEVANRGQEDLLADAGSDNATGDIDEDEDDDELEEAAQ